jgi:hypothetical protein
LQTFPREDLGRRMVEIYMDMLSKKMAEIKIMEIEKSNSCKYENTVES